MDRRSLPICNRAFDGKLCRKRGEHLCEPRAHHVKAFFVELLVHTKGDWARKPFIPTPWQEVEVLRPLFGLVVWDPERERYVRKYRELYLFIARKNGKTELLAGIVLYLLVGDGEESAEIYGLALDRDQASQVYRVASRMVELNPILSARLQQVKYARRIVDPKTASFYAVTAGDALGSLGGNPHGAYIDELLTQPSRDLYDVLKTGWGARAQPLLLMATTAENDPNGFAASERVWSERVIETPSLDPRRLVVMYRTDPDEDWTSPAVWRKANPALGDFLDIKVLEDECAKAIENPAAERAFRQYRLNQPSQQTGRAIKLPQWDRSRGPLDWTELLDASTGVEVFAGLDLASTSDLASYALVYAIEDGFRAIWRHFAPEALLSALDRRTGGMATVWASSGALTVTDGDVIDYGEIIESLERDRERVEIIEVAFDPWGATQLSQTLTDRGWPLVSFRQGFASLAAPTAEFLRLVAAGRFHHGGNPVARWQAANLITRSDPAGNLKPDKAKSMDKIDGIVAAIMGLDRAIRREQAEPEPEYAAAGW
jgi:phage terminase large subunit-like protein